MDWCEQAQVLQFHHRWSAVAPLSCCGLSERDCFTWLPSSIPQ